MQQKEKSRKAPVRVGKPNLFSCFSYLQKCRKPSCDYWHPPDCSPTRRKKVAKFGEKCAFLHSDNSEALHKKSKKDQKSEKATIASVTPRSHQKLGCVSKDFDLPKPKVVLTREIRPILKNNVGIPPIVHLELQYAITAERYSSRFGNIWVHLWELSRVDTNIIAIPTRLGLENGDPNNTLWAKEDARKAAWHWAKKLPTNIAKRSWPRTSLLTRDMVHCWRLPTTVLTAWVARHDRHNTTSGRLSSGTISGTFSQENGIPTSGKKFKHCILLRRARFHFANAMTECLSPFLVDQGRHTLRVQQKIQLKAPRS